jgi:hypothetical protein
VRVARSDELTRGLFLLQERSRTSASVGSDELTRDLFLLQERSRTSASGRSASGSFGRTDARFVLVAGEKPYKCQWPECE